MSKKSTPTNAASDDVTRRMSTEQITEFIWESLEETGHAATRSTRSSNQSPLTRSGSPRMLPIVLVSVAIIGCGLLAMYMWRSVNENEASSGDEKPARRPRTHHSHAHQENCTHGKKSAGESSEPSSSLLVPGDSTAFKKRGSSIGCTCECTCGAEEIDLDILEEIRNEVIEEKTEMQSHLSEGMGSR